MSALQSLTHQLQAAKNRLEQLRKSKSKVDTLEALALVNKINTIEFKIRVINDK